jgi:hypothetical protein
MPNAYGISSAGSGTQGRSGVLADYPRKWFMQ